MFTIKHETKPGQLTVTVAEAEIVDYCQLINDTYTINGLYMWADNIGSSKAITAIDGLKDQIEFLRNRKLNHLMD